MLINGECSGSGIADRLTAKLLEVKIPVHLPLPLLHFEPQRNMKQSSSTRQGLSLSLDKAETSTDSNIAASTSIALAFSFPVCPLTYIMHTKEKVISQPKPHTSNHTAGRI